MPQKAHPNSGFSRCAVFIRMAHPTQGLKPIEQWGTPDGTTEVVPLRKSRTRYPVRGVFVATSSSHHQRSALPRLITRHCSSCRGGLCPSASRLSRPVPSGLRRHFKPSVCDSGAPKVYIPLPTTCSGGWIGNGGRKSALCAPFATSVDNIALRSHNRVRSMWYACNAQGVPQRDSC